MPLYRYKALNSRGEMLEGQMEGASDTEVAQRLQDQGHLPVEAVAVAAVERVGGRRLKARPLAGRALVQFTQQLATLLAAGQPLDRGMTILLELPEDEASKRVITGIRDAVRGGSSLSAALERQHGIFGKLYVNMVRAGEAGGNLHETLARLADYLERSRALKERVLNAMIYPAILFGMVSLSLLFLLGFVVPQFAAMYDSLDAPLPWFSSAVLAIGLLVRDWWIVLLAVPAAALWAVDRKLRDIAFRDAFDRWILRRRYFGALLAKLDTARLARTLGTLLRNGVPLLKAMAIARNVLDNRALAGDVDAASELVREGSGLAGALGRGKRFPRLALQMIQVGEESGALDAMLLKAADIFERETSLALDRMLAALVPVVTIVLAAIVALVILAVLTPIYDLTNAIG